MNHAHEQNSELMRYSRGLRRQADQPSKARRHRYERRKVRSLIRLSDWAGEDLY